MMNFLEKSRNQLVRLFFPFVERFYLVLSLGLLVVAWSTFEAYWRIRVILFWLWMVISEIQSAGVRKRDYLPIQSGSGIFPRVYRFVDQAFFLFLLILLIVLLLPVSLWLKQVLLGVLVLAVILRAIGERKFRPKKPEE